MSVGLSLTTNLKATPNGKLHGNNKELTSGHQESTREKGKNQETIETRAYNVSFSLIFWISIISFLTNFHHSD
jgi:hypothetical protein